MTVQELMDALVSMDPAKPAWIRDADTNWMLGITDVEVLPKAVVLNSDYHTDINPKRDEVEAAAERADLP